MKPTKRRFFMVVAACISLGGLLTYVWKRQEHAEELFVLQLSSSLETVAETNRGPESAHLLTGHTNYYGLLLHIDKALAYRLGWTNQDTGKWVFEGMESPVIAWLKKTLGQDFHLPQTKILVKLVDGRAVKGPPTKRYSIEPAWSTLDVRTVRGEPGPQTPLFTEGVPGWSIRQER